MAWLESAFNKLSRSSDILQDRSVSLHWLEVESEELSGL